VGPEIRITGAAIGSVYVEHIELILLTVFSRLIIDHGLCDMKLRTGLRGVWETSNCCLAVPVLYVGSE
jgi:hypothetical protein